MVHEANKNQIRQTSTARRRIVIWGAGSHANVVADILALGDEYDLVGFIDDVNPDRQGTTVRGLPVFGGMEQLGRLRADGVAYLAWGFGHCGRRLQHAQHAEEADITIVSVIHPQAILASDVQVGVGTVIKAGAVFDPGVHVGRHVLIGAGVTVGHDCEIQDGVRLSGGVDLAGHVTIGRGAAVGTGTAVKDGVHIGAGALVGVGSVVVRDVPAGTVAFGVPARPARRVAEGEV